MISFMQNSITVRSFIHKLCVFYACVLFCSPPRVLARECLGRDQCSCAFDDDQSVIALNSLGNTNAEPRFKDVTSKDGSTYSYNPCYPFTEGSGDCNGAAENCGLVDIKHGSRGYGIFHFKACETSLGQTSSIGEAQTAQFTYSDGDVVVGYTAGSGILTSTQVTLKCDEHACEPSIVAEGNESPSLYAFTLTTVCACPNGCTEAGPVNCKSKSSGIGGGAVFLIVFFAFVFVYMVGGTVFLAVGRKARGREMIPNIGFWTSLPGLIKDGVLFTLRPCLGKKMGYTST